VTSPERDSRIIQSRLRNFSIIGEAAKRLDDGYQTAHPEIPWRALDGLRDVLTHQYEGVDPERVLPIAERELPNLRAAIAALLPPLDQMERELAGEEDAPGQYR
jgi:uncharacterized protein with HEPN domain